MDTISGGVIPTGGSVKLTIDSNKIGYVILPNKSVLTTVSGVINTTYAGVAGLITYYVPKNTNTASIANSGVQGGIVYNGLNILDCDGNTALTSIVANNTKTIYATGASLTAKAIGDILKKLYDFNVNACELAFDGGANAIEGSVNTYLQSAYIGLTYATVYARLATANGGTILIDTV